MPRFRKKPVEIDAVQLRWGTWGEVCEFLGPEFFATGGRGCYRHADGSFHDGPPRGFNPIEAGLGEYTIALRIPTLEGDLYAGDGDWIIRGIAGELYPCKDAIFRATYEPVDSDAEIAFASVTA